MELGALLELNLHTHTAEVEEITDQALKEEKMESALKRLDEVWANVNFVSSPYKEGSDIMLLAIAEEDYDMCVHGKGLVCACARVWAGVGARERSSTHAGSSRDSVLVCVLVCVIPGWRTTS